jgi:hypothetical protein
MTDNITWLDIDYEPMKDGIVEAEPATNPMFEEDEWEDGDFQHSIHAKFPNWYLVKMTGFTAVTYAEVAPWLEENVKFGKYERVGWSDGCSTSVGVVFEHGRDAMMFKLRWR